MGFEEQEAEDNIAAEQPGLDDGVFGRQTRALPGLTLDVVSSADDARAMAAVVPAKVRTIEDDAGRVTVQVTGFLNPEEKQALVAAAPAPLRMRVQEQIATYEAEHAQEIPPAVRGATFVVPGLVVPLQGELLLADTDTLMEYHSWSLSDKPAQLLKAEFDLVETAHSFEIDIDGNRVQIGHVDATAQLGLAIDVEGWTENGLVQWLDKKLRDPWIAQTERLKWLSDVVHFLVHDRQLPLAQLMRCKFLLARKLGNKIKAFRQQERESVYQQELFGPEAAPEVSFEQSFAFTEGMYEGTPKYRGRYRLNKHFLGADNVPAFDGVEGGEEEQCAFIIDGLPGVKYWLRNVSQHPQSFWLPTASDKFYPDFVVQLGDGRLLVVEYKGADRIDNEDSREKALIGERWAKVSEGRGLFAMVTTRDGPGEVRKALMEVVG